MEKICPYMAEPVSDKEVAKGLFSALKEDTSKVNEISAESLYSVQLESGKELISAEDFESMNLKKDLLSGMYAMGLEKPTHIQNIAVPHILGGSDVAFHSKSGTGKTIAFALGALQKVEPGKGPQVIILTPTRELSNQVGGVIKKLGSFIGANVCFALRDFVADSIPEEIVVGSPGKILGLLNNKAIDSQNVVMVILDEADELISQQTFCAQTLKLLKLLGRAQKVFFSATYSDFSRASVKKLAPKCDTFFEKNVKADKIQLYYIEIDKNLKIDALKSLLELLTIAQVIVFVATRNMVDIISRNLVAERHSVSSIHGHMDASVRDQAFQDFLQAKTKILITTDVFSRGMDIPQVNLIVNFDLPMSSNESFEESYIHRIGRSGRFNRSGFVIDFVSGAEDLRTLTQIQTYNGTISQRFTLGALEEIFGEEDVGSS